jgi:hypothetical protein
MSGKWRSVQFSLDVRPDSVRSFRNVIGVIFCFYYKHCTLSHPSSATWTECMCFVSQPMTVRTLGLVRHAHMQYCANGSLLTKKGLYELRWSLHTVSFILPRHFIYVSQAFDRFLVVPPIFMRYHSSSCIHPIRTVQPHSKSFGTSGPNSRGSPFCFAILIFDTVIRESCNVSIAVIPVNKLSMRECHGCTLVGYNS